MTDETKPVPTTARDRIRATVLKTRQAKRKTVEFFGEQIEIVQPLLGDILRAQDSEDQESAVIDILIKYARVPGTDQALFDSSDADVFKQQPFGQDFLNISSALEELTNVNFQAPSASSGKTS